MTERLEEIKSRVWKEKCTYAMGDYSQREGYIYTLSDYDYEWLVKQAKKIELLNAEIETLQAKWEAQGLMIQKLHRENQRYKRFIEHFAYCDEDYEGMLRLQNEAKKLNVTDK